MYNFLTKSEVDGIESSCSCLTCEGVAWWSWDASRAISRSGRREEDSERRRGVGRSSREDEAR